MPISCFENVVSHHTSSKHAYMHAHHPILVLNPEVQHSVMCIVRLQYIFWAHASSSWQMQQGMYVQQR